MNPPAFWSAPEPTMLARLLAPLSTLYGAATARRVARPGWRAPVPVLCCGNATVGGAGKTTLTLDLGERLIARGVRVAFLTRGYGGGGSAGVLRADPARHAYTAVGDEALLLAALAPTYVAADRAAAARAAVAEGAQALLMDDGLQNPTLAKTVSFMVIDGAAGFGNGCVLPAGPLREPVAAAASRCAAGVLIGEHAREAMASLPPALPILRAHLESAFVPPARVYAFAGIGRPAKFFDSLAVAGAEIAGTAAFPDHHPYSTADIARVLAEAALLGAVAVTTPKDFVRLQADQAEQVQPVGVRLIWDDPAAIAAWLDRLMQP